jgi:hypothetical protein
MVPASQRPPVTAELQGAAAKRSDCAWRENGRVWQSTVLLSLCACLLSSTGAHGAAVNACDLNGDGVVDQADVQAAINMIIGISPCTAGIAGTNECDVVIVQRVVNAALGEPCLTSTGIHVAVVTWTASTSPDVTGYKIYRRTRSGSYKLLATPGNVSSYLDTTVVSGASYVYAVSAVNGNNQESALSEAARVEIPIP